MPGIYSTWEKCQEQVNGFDSARFKSFESRAEAENALRLFPEGPVRNLSAVKGETLQKKGTARKPNGLAANVNPYSICVDAACAGNPGVMEYRCVETISKKEIFHSPIFRVGTNNIGEFLAIVHALALFYEKDPKLIIYSDSLTALGWVKKKKTKSLLVRDKSTEKLWELIDRGEKWLQSHVWKNPLLKWETEKWGEIPADFGRK